LRTILTECAWGATRRKDGFLRRKYYTISARRGKKKALFAVGHKILIAAYFVLLKLEPYKEPADDSQKRKQKQIKNLRERLKELEAAG
jgi:transposase